MGPQWQLARSFEAPGTIVPEQTPVKTNSKFLLFVLLGLFGFTVLSWIAKSQVAGITQNFAGNLKGNKPKVSSFVHSL